jgi:hypothetical protein
MKRLLPAFLFTLMALSAAASGYPVTFEVIIVSGGKFGDANNYVRIGSYNVKTKEYTVFDSIKAPSTKSVLGTDYKHPAAYVTADTVLIKYDMRTHTRKAISPSAKGHVYMARYDKYIVATRGYGATSDFVKIYDSADLSLVASIAGISGEAADLYVYADTAYVLVPGSFGSKTGKIAVVDLKNKVLNREIDLDTMGAGLDKFFAGKDAGIIHTINLTHNTLITLDMTTGNVTYKSLDKDVTRVFNQSEGVVFMEIDNSWVAEYILSDGTFWKDTVLTYNKIPGVTSNWDIANIRSDDFGPSLYVATTDYFSYGRVYVYNFNKIVDTVETGISPEAIGLYWDIVTGIHDEQRKEIKLDIYPNPSSTQITCILPEMSRGSYRILSSAGQVISTAAFGNTRALKVDVQNLRSGLYFMQVNTQEGTSTTRFVRQ